MPALEVRPGNVDVHVAVHVAVRRAAVAHHSRRILCSGPTPHHIRCSGHCSGGTILRSDSTIHNRRSRCILRSGSTIRRSGSTLRCRSTIHQGLAFLHSLRRWWGSRCSALLPCVWKHTPRKRRAHLSSQQLEVLAHSGTSCVNPALDFRLAVLRAAVAHHSRCSGPILRHIHRIRRSHRLRQIHRIRTTLRCGGTIHSLRRICRSRITLRCGSTIHRIHRILRSGCILRVPRNSMSESPERPIGRQRNHVRRQRPLKLRHPRELHVRWQLHVVCCFALCRQLIAQGLVRCKDRALLGAVELPPHAGRHRQLATQALASPRGGTLQKRDGFALKQAIDRNGCRSVCSLEGWC
jgi:hypothetical protein